MSRGNDEVLKRGVHAFNQGDMEEMLAMLDPDVEFVTAAVFPGVSPVYRGHKGWLTFWREFRETWDSLGIETNQVREVGDRILLLMTFDARGRNGLEVRRKFANVWTVRDGLVVRIQSYSDWGPALEAVGQPA